MHVGKSSVTSNDRTLAAGRQSPLRRGNKYSLWLLPLCILMSLENTDEQVAVPSGESTQNRNQ